MFVYIIVNDVNFKIYVGKTKKNNLEAYLRQKFTYSTNDRALRSHLFNAIRKYGREHFHIYSLFEGTTNEEICEHEKLIIKSLASQNSNIGYNICAGGEGRTGPLTPEQNAKLRVDNMKYWDELGLVGKVFNRLTVISKAEKATKRGGKRRWNCQCVCGNTSVVSTNALKSGAVKSCGCLHTENVRKVANSMINRVFGALTVESEAGKNKHRQLLWKCLCTCGNYTTVSTNTLMAGTTQSCGYDCGNKKHLKLKEEAFRLQEMGWLQKDISKEVGISQGTCSVWLKEMNGGKSGRVHWRTNHSISAQHGPVG